MYRAPVIEAMVVGLLGALGVMIWLGAGTAEATFPGDNGRIVFVSFRDGDTEIFTMNADGTGVRKLTNNSVSDFDPAWSADGKKIAFARIRHDGNGDIYMMNSDGTGVRRLTDYSLLDRMPTWSPDGTEIAFVRAQGGDESWEIFSMKVDRSEPATNLTRDSGSDRQPDWSPNGDLIAFDSTRRFSGSQDIYTMTPEGAVVNNITGTHPAYDADPSWSPDASLIAFTTTRDGNREIYTTDGISIPTRLTNNPAKDEMPAFSPDGSKIAFTSDRAGNKGIYTMNSDGTGIRRLTSNLTWDEDPDWQPNNVRTPIALPTPPFWVPTPAPGLIIRDHVPPDHLTPIKVVGRDQQKDLEDDTELFVDGKGG